VLTPSRTELDLGSVDSVQSWLQRTTLDVDALINNAGENPLGGLDQLSLAVWERALMVNLTGPMLLAQAASAGMRRRGWGRVVNIGSIFSFVSRSARGPYSAAKAGLLGLTRAAAIEWGGDNVLVNAVCPGYIETDLTRQNNTPEQVQALCAQLPLRRLGQPDEVAKAVYFLGSEQNSFITGQTLVIDGGFTAQ